MPAGGPTVPAAAVPGAPPPDPEDPLKSRVTTHFNPKGTLLEETILWGHLS